MKLGGEGSSGSITSRGSRTSLYRPAITIERVVGTNVKEAPITAGNQVPNNVWVNVFKAATNSSV